jgi:NADPH:quinone reductase-like Zn-dependent oxidoreductase
MQVNEWGVSTYPLIAGHEGVGKITKVGKLCPSFKEGDLVGIGWMVKIYFLIANFPTFKLNRRSFSGGFLWRMPSLPQRNGESVRARIRRNHFEHQCGTLVI